ncbi:sigma factor-like helix-turn-helix DNA-binding protein [Cystobacter fuscus]|nr:sigma factor-like helix-turn-helix DNA-binding protein [Cystobacter fuscus]
MRKLRELLRQRLELKLSVREIARSLGIGVGTVNRYLYRAQAAKLRSWPLPPELDDDAALTALLFADEGKVVAWSSRAGNVEKGRVAVELELKNPGTKPWTLAGAMLRGAKGEELTPLPDATPVSILPGFSK